MIWLDQFGDHSISKIYHSYNIN